MEELDGLSFNGEALDEDTVLSLVRAERVACVGLDNNDELNVQREQALEYYRGRVPDIDAQRDENDERSRAVSTDLADAVETVLPDLMEVFTGGEDGLSFSPVGEEDVDAAEQETNALRQAFFQHNNGFYVLYESFKEALLLKTGIFHWYWDEDDEYEDFEGEASAVELQQYQQNGLELVSAEAVEDQEDLYQYQARRLVKPARAKVVAWPANDFGVARDTVHLRDTTYCTGRCSKRMQDLISIGLDADKVRMLTNDELDEDEGVEIARDVAYESNDEIEPGLGDLRNVEIMVHYLRVDFEGTEKPQVWRITTGNNETVLLDIEKRSRIEFSSVCPFPMAHRFFGQSLADKLIQIQQIKSALARLMLDSGYYSIHQRPVIAMEDASDETLDDMDDNNPGSYIRVERQGAIGTLNTGGLPFDVLGAMEYTSTMAEQRTGVVRNAQGLNPDTLHDTARGAEALMGAAQKRVRMIARLFAETGVKDMFLGLHDLMRSNSNHSDMIQLNNKFVPVNPSAWQRRQDMVIEIGVGSGGRDQDLAGKRELAGLMTQILEAQATGIIDKQIVTAKNVYALTKSLGDRLGEKRITTYFTDPDAPPDPNEQPQQEGPSPEEQAAQAEMAMKHQQFQTEMELERAKAKAAAEIEQFKASEKAKLDRERAQFEAELAEDKALAEFRLAQMRTHGSVELSNDRPGGSLAK